MKKTILEKTIDFVEKQNQQIRHHETIQKQMKKQIKLFDRLSQEWFRNNGHRWDFSSLKLVSHQTYRSKIKKVEWFS